MTENSNRNEEDVAMERFVKSEVLFRRALKENSKEAMRCAICYSDPMPRSSKRAKERHLYLNHFAAKHFAGLSFAPHRCLVVPTPVFPARELAEKVCNGFSWQKYANPDVIFTV